MAKAKAKGWDAFKAAPDSMLKICEWVQSGESLASFCRNQEFAYVTVLDWIEADTGRSENYARAKEARSDLVFESLDEVSDEAAQAETAVQVAGLRLKADNIKWKLARMSPKKYGEKLALGGADDLPPMKTELSDLRGLNATELDTLKRLLAKGRAALEAGTA